MNQPAQPVPIPPPVKATGFYTVGDAKRHAGAASKWAVIATMMVSSFEGVKLYAYRDPVGIPTVCFGETLRVKMGDTYTRTQCQDMLLPRLQQFRVGVFKCLNDNVPLTPERDAALVSFAYNVGVGAFCKSSIARELNAGHIQVACDNLRKYEWASSIFLRGLAVRREKERAYCLAA